MSDSLPIVSVVVLSYARPRLLREALASVCAQSYACLDVTVVDNRSPRSDEVARVVAEFQGVRLLRNGENLGFAAGMNRGVALAAGQYVYLTEDDIVLERECISSLVKHVEAHPATGLASPVMYDREGGAIRCAGGDFALGGVYRKTVHGAGDRDGERYAEPFGVTYVVGACVFARAEFLRRMGGFREEFFMYVEDVELCARVAAAGAAMTVVPRAKVYHFEPAAASASAPELDFHRYKNFFALYLLHAPARVLPEFFLRYALLGLLRAPLAGGNARALLRAVAWAARRAPSLIRERRAARAAPNAAEIYTDAYAGD